MDKQKQIEEMARIIAFDLCPNRHAHAKWGEEAKCYSDNNFAECTKIKNVVDKLYNAGYRKIPENAVVLTREEKQEYENLVKLFFYDKPIKNRVYEFIKDTKDQVRKETAEKFAERLKEELENHSPIDGYDLEDLEFDGETIQECIDEIAKGIIGERE